MTYDKLALELNQSQGNSIRLREVAVNTLQQVGRGLLMALPPGLVYNCLITKAQFQSCPPCCSYLTPRFNCSHPTIQKLSFFKPKTSTKHLASSLIPSNIQSYTQQHSYCVTPDYCNGGGGWAPCDSSSLWLTLLRGSPGYSRPLRLDWGKHISPRQDGTALVGY